MRASRLATALAAGLLAQAVHANDLPACFKMDTGTLGRFYVVAPDTSVFDPMAYGSNTASTNVRVYEYYMGPASSANPAKHSLILQASMYGMASIYPTGEVDGVTAGTVTGLDNSAGTVFTTRLSSQINPDGSRSWSAERSTFTGSLTTHTLVRTACDLPDL